MAKNEKIVSDTRNLLLVVAQRRHGGDYRGELTAPSGADPGVVLFHIIDLLVISQALEDATPLASQLPQKDEVLTALQMARDALGDSPRIAAQHYEAGAFRSCQGICENACSLLESDAAPELLRVAAKLGVEPIETLVERADRIMAAELRRNLEAQEWSARKWETFTGIDKDTIIKTLVWKSLQEAKFNADQDRQRAAVEAEGKPRGQRFKKSTLGRWEDSE